ncbi:hypothetical protein [Viridibacillus arvi]|uniref:hypothetical protein n=1 Tax=Viridibacillus arvi TaxID=263475 RepID=UPI003D051568
MIIDAIIKPLFFILESLMGLLPVMNLRTIFNGVTEVGSLFNALSVVSCFMPVDTVIQIIALIFTIYTISVGWAFLNWLIAKIPTIN